MASVLNSTGLATLNNYVAPVLGPNKPGIVPQVYSGSTGSGTSQNASTNSYGGYTPTTISGGVQGSVLGASTDRINGISVNPNVPNANGTSYGGGSVSPTFYAAPAQTPQTITSASFNGGSSISLPSSPSISNPGVVGNAGLINSLATTHQYDPATNTFKEITANPTENPEDAAAKERKNSLQELLGLIPQKENILQSPEIVAQNAEVNRNKQIVNDYTSQLNGVVAKQNQDLLTLRGTGSKEGVTEAVYGGQAAEINREAAVRALPLQASISAAQGNLSLAQDYLGQITAIKTEQVNNTYEYNKAKYEAIKDNVTAEEKITLDKLSKENDRAYQAGQDLIKTQASLATTALQNGAPASTISNIYASKDQKGAFTAAGTYGADKKNQIVELADGSKVLVDTNTGKIVSTIGAGGNGGAVLGASTDANGVNLNTAFSFATSNLTKDQRTNATNTFNSLVKQGKTEEAKSYIDKLLLDKLPSVQRGEIDTMGTVKDLADKVLSYNTDGKLEGIGGFGYGTAASRIDAVFGNSSEEARTVRSLIGNIKGTVAKLRGGTSFTPNEEALLNSYVPTINETPAVAINKINLLKDFINKKRNQTLYGGQEQILNPQTQTQGSSETESAKSKYGLTY